MATMVLVVLAPVGSVRIMQYVTRRMESVHTSSVCLGGKKVHVTNVSMGKCNFELINTNTFLVTLL